MVKSRLPITRRNASRAGVIGVMGLLPLAIAMAFGPSIVLASASATVAPPPIIKDCPMCPDMVTVPAGRFRMGSNDGEPGRPEGPIRDVALAKSFALGRFEVTNAEFRAFVESTGYAVTPGCRSQQAIANIDGRMRFAVQAERNWLSPGFLTERQAAHPVVCVSHADATAYAAWLSRTTGERYRLPTEAEWEYAARGGADGIYPWGNNIDLACGHANVFDRKARSVYEFGWGFADCDDGYVELAPVGQFAANGFGLHDMIGNVWEWTADCYQLTYDEAPTDGSAVIPEGDCARWTVRGGGWMTRPSRQRLTFRGRDPVDARYSYFGFRVARDLTQGEARP